MCRATHSFFFWRALFRSGEEPFLSLSRKKFIRCNTLSHSYTIYGIFALAGGKIASLILTLSVCRIMGYGEEAKKPIKIERRRKNAQNVLINVHKLFVLVCLTTNIWQMPFKNEIRNRFPNMFCWLPTFCDDASYWLFSIHTFDAVWL